MTGNTNGVMLVQFLIMKNDTEWSSSKELGNENNKRCDRAAVGGMI
jgi:hypothetical protein